MKKRSTRNSNRSEGYSDAAASRAGRPTTPRGPGRGGRGGRVGPTSNLRPATHSASDRADQEEVVASHETTMMGTSWLGGLMSSLMGGRQTPDTTLQPVTSTSGKTRGGRPIGQPEAIRRANDRPLQGSDTDGDDEDSNPELEGNLNVTRIERNVQEQVCNQSGDVT